MRRLSAVRIFPYEIDNSKFVIKKDLDKYTQNFLLSPLGALINRVYLVGTIIFKDSDEKKGYTLRVSTPGASFYIRTGIFLSSEIKNKTEELKEGDIVAVLGRIKIFQPAGSDRIYSYVRPENLEKTSSTTLKYWIYDTSKWTLVRIRAIQTAMDLENPSVDSLINLGIDREIAEGAILAIEKYGKENINLEKYLNIVELALQYIIPSVTLEEKVIEEKVEADEIESEESIQDSVEQAISTEEKVLSIISSCDHNGGAKYEDIIAVAEDEGISKEELDRILIDLLERGFIKEYKGRYQIVI